MNHAVSPGVQGQTNGLSVERNGLRTTETSIQNTYYSDY